MAGPPNVKRILNGEMRAAMEQTKCDLANLQDLTRDFDGDLVEAVCLENEHRDKVAEEAMAVDKALNGELSSFRGTLKVYAAKYARMRKQLDLG